MRISRRDILRGAVKLAGNDTRTVALHGSRGNRVTAERLLHDGSASE
jgi:hypothetical protein